MNIHQQEKALEALKDWSKWIVSLNFGAATGCVIILQNGVSSLVRMYLITAVLFFFLSILIASFIFVLLPAIIQKLPIQTKSKQMISIFDYQFASFFNLRMLVSMQLLFFVIGVGCLFTWILLKK